MSKTMKLFGKSTAAILGAAVLMTAAPASAQINSVSSLLDKVRADSAKTEQENRAREATFRQKRDQQAGLLGQARGELNSLEAKARSVQSTFDGNQGRIDRLEAELKTAQGDFGEVFGLARSKAGEFKAILDNSLITSQYPDRTEVLGRVAESKALPNSDELNAIWQRMLQEIQAQRKVATYTAKVANVADGADQEVTRVGPFTVFTKANGDFLDYRAPSADADGEKILLAQLPKQPKGAINAASAAVASASGDGIVYAPIDPTRGGLLKSFERVPDWNERIAQGGFIGAFIWWGMWVVLALGAINLIRLFLTSIAVRGQKRSAKAKKGNPLGRIMMAYDNAKNKDAETVELKLDEAILRESPKLEFGLSLLKLAAGIAPLFGLLGTVTGMIKTFQAMMIYGTGDPQLMAGGISEALVTTMLGLIAAIPLLIMHSFSASIARGVQNTLEEQSAGIVARHVESQHG